jgi:serine/threonine protein kinase
MEQLIHSRRPGPFQDCLSITRSLSKQILSIADALRLIHTSESRIFVSIRSKTANAKLNYGRHGDISPRNILWFQTQDPGVVGQLKLFDLGVTTFHAQPEYTKLRSTKFKYKYLHAAPELKHSEGLSRVFRANDIWSLGCVLVKLMTWFLLGPNGTEDLKDRLDNSGGSFFSREIERPRQLSVSPPHGGAAAVLNATVARVSSIMVYSHEYPLL